ncbi:hypothetical protein [Vibrio sp. THAF190c]|uniref:hypothetical protein n=1 Tax=Vibrio sp. THAF190c TaxID=2587865 RepID=UPI0012684AE2|nr:hypothetical protein [Vibrio sp. THAF190c]QFT09732.1 hypothetical protein FIV04_07100 [Vibrio sp. THAF190c]QFT09740.1 hypothetical protein FIV04_07140 [Vibrio sp. THAF190c]QFT09748.1 hypothetical protein FIV04_07180 [Vibrio sp. THAF190c]
MFCVNPENGYLAVKQLAADGVFQFTSLYTANELTVVSDQISKADVAMIVGAVASLYGLVFVIKLVLQQLGYRS